MSGMIYDFDTPLIRGSECTKWSKYAPDVLPLWVADMDFHSPEPVVQALLDRVQQRVFGYPNGRPDGLLDVIQERLRVRHRWTVSRDSIHIIAGGVTSLNVCARAVTQPGDGIAIMTPLYPPFLNAIELAGCVRNDALMAERRDGARLRYEVDANALEAAITPRTRLLMLSNPHNPVGRAYTRAELEQLADIALRHDLMICSDELHCDLMLDDREHISIATLGPEIAQRCITMLSPSKTFNLAGLYTGFLVVENPDLMARVKQAAEGIVPGVNLMGLVAAEAAYRGGQPWLDQVLDYLRGNRDALVAFVESKLPGVRVTCPEGTYLAWLDCRDLPLTEGQSPYEFFLNEARVGLNDGAVFGRGGEGFVRLNFGCARSVLIDALERMRTSLEQVSA